MTGTPPETPTPTELLATIKDKLRSCNRELEELEARYSDLRLQWLALPEELTRNDPDVEFEDEFSDDEDSHDFSPAPKRLC